MLDLRPEERCWKPLTLGRLAQLGGLMQISNRGAQEQQLISILQKLLAFAADNPKVPWRQDDSSSVIPQFFLFSDTDYFQLNSETKRSTKG